MATDGGGRRVLRGRVVTPDEVLEDGVVVLDGDLIMWVGHARDAPSECGRLPSPTQVTLLPGLVDLHCHGGGGAGFGEAGDAVVVRTAVAEHMRQGTTTLVASVVSASESVLVERVAVLAGCAEAGEIAGIHLEGPFLSSARCGAQDPSCLQAGDAGLVRELAAVARGHLVTMTVAPEVLGVLGRGGVLATLVELGVVPSIGHTDASAELVEEALSRAWSTMGGRRPTVTHLFNAMRPFHHRDPGSVAGCLAAAGRGRAVLELVADGVHVSPQTARGIVELFGPQSVAFVTDAMAAAGMPDGRYRLGSMQVEVRDAVARLAGTETIAGGTSHLLDVVRLVVGAGVGLAAAVRAASSTPAEVLGRSDVGALAAGRRGDVVVTDGDLRPLMVVHAGREVVG